MYQILCDDKILYDPRDEDFFVCNPKCKLAVNTVGEASFSIDNGHPHYEDLKKLKSVFEIRQDGFPIFRGRMTDDTRDFDNIKAVDLEGAMAYFNDSIIKPFTFPDGFLNNAGYVQAAASGNVVEFFLGWLINQHNSQVQDFQRFKLGRVTVADPNNYVSRESTDHLKTWEVLKTKLFESALGGYLCIRYENDGNYIDYLADFELTNTQKIVFGENLLDLTSASDASSTYTAILPLGKKKSEIDTESNDDSRLTIEALGDGDITSDLVKKGDTIYSKSGVEQYGWIYAPVSETTWDDVTTAANLQSNGVDYMQNTALKLANTITIKAVDLHYSDEEIASFKLYRYILVESAPHNHEDRYKLSELDIDIQNPQNTVITLGDTQMTMTDINASTKKEVANRVEVAQKNTNAFTEEIRKEVKTQIDTFTEEVSETLDDLVETDSELQNQIDAITDSLDNEWAVLEIDEAFSLFNAEETNQPMFKVTGNVVEVKGCVSPVEELAAITEKVVFARGLPSEARPSSMRSFICQGSGMDLWQLTIETDGSLTIARYGVAEAVAVPTSACLLFNGTYMV